MFIKTIINDKLTYFQVCSLQIIKKSKNEFFIRYWTSPSSIDDDNYIDDLSHIYKSELEASERIEYKLINNKIRTIK